MRPLFRFVPTVVSVAILAAPIAAQSSLEVVRANPAARLQAKVTPSCQGGLVNDDGTVENALAFQGPPDGPATVDLVTRLNAGQTGALLEQVCVCWTRANTLVDSVDFDLVFYDTTGPGGSPGALLRRVPATASGIPPFESVAFFEFDVATLDIRTTAPGIYVGTSWQSYIDGPDPRFFVCTDENGPGDEPIYATDDPTAGWSDLAILEEEAQLPTRTHALFVRTDVEGGTIAPCIEGDSTLCLNNGRFQVEIDWRSPTDQGVGMAEGLTQDTGYFWFFSQNNVEMVIKVLDACAINNHYWVFAGGLTNVEVDITVTDTTTGAFQTYRNPIETPFQPIQDTEAFATCP